MALLKEDGSLDIERINALPIEEYLQEMRTLTQEQVQEYLSKLPPAEILGPVRPMIVDAPMDVDEEIH